MLSLYLYKEVIFINFYDWCLENNHQDYLSLWDYELNQVTPKDIRCKTHKKYYFKCNNHHNHPSELKRIDNITHQPHSIDCKRCQSFGWFLEQNNMLSYWDYDKNTVDMYNINAQVNKKIWIKCQQKNDHPSYEITGSHFYLGGRCPYCAGKKVIPQESLIGYYPIVGKIWSDKNQTSPDIYTPSSNKKAWWKCKNQIHEDFYKSIVVMSRDGFHCPKCSEEKKNSYLQTKVKNYFEQLGYTVKTEFECSIVPVSLLSGRKLPYDNEIIELKLIAEVHGIQHYQPQNAGWYKHRAISENKTVEEIINKRQYYDDYKKEYALNHGYNYLIIPYWAEKNDEYKQLIDNKLKEIA